MVKNQNNPFREVQSIGIVCIDGLRLSPVAATLLRDYLRKSKKPNVRGISVDYAGYKRSGNKISDSAKGFLQTKGFGTSDMLEVQRISKYWLQTKDLILVMDRFLKRDILYDFFSTKTQEMRDKILIINEAAGIGEKIRDPRDDYTIPIKPVFELIEKCCIEIVKRLEQYN